MSSTVQSVQDVWSHIRFSFLASVRSARAFIEFCFLTIMLGDPFSACDHQTGRGPSARCRAGAENTIGLSTWLLLKLTRPHQHRTRPR